MSRKVLITFRSSHERPTLESLKKRFGLDDVDVDTAFGVIETDEEMKLFTALVEPAAAAKIVAADPTATIYADSPITPFDSE